MKKNRFILTSRVIGLQLKKPPFTVQKKKCFGFDRDKDRKI